MQAVVGISAADAVMASYIEKRTMRVEDARRAVLAAAAAAAHAGVPRDHIVEQALDPMGDIAGAITEYVARHQVGSETHYPRHSSSVVARSSPLGSVCALINRTCDVVMVASCS